MCSIVQAQSVTELVTDFGGYWISSHASINPVHPNNSHNLAAFSWNGVRYSTGVNDALLTSRGLTFTPGSYKALPISALSAAPTAGTYIGLGQLYDGVATGGSSPPPANNIPFYLTDGANGLNMGTAVYNLPASNLTFEIGLFNIARIGDGIPDIIVTQVGEISSSSIDSFKFINPSGGTVGNAIAVTFAGADSLGIIDMDFYNASVSPMTFASGFYPSNTKRAVRMYAFELSDFGLNSSNFGLIDKFVERLSGSSDQAFVAYNTATIQILPNSNPGCFATMPGLWLKANDGTSTIINDQKNALWQDRSPNTYTMEQNTTANQPQFKDATNAFNFNAHLNFDAANKLVAPNSPFTAITNNTDIFIVGRPTNATVKNKIIGFSRNATDNSGTGAGDFPAISYNELGQVAVDSGTVNLLTGTATGNLNTIFLEQINYTQGAGASIQLSKNGTADGSVSTAKNLGTFTFQLGDMAPGDNGSDLDLAEVIIFPSNLAATERQIVETYLALKYGITLSHNFISGAGTTYWNLANNTGYNNNLFGIGREDCQGMHRKQSKSINPAALVTIGNIAIAPDNISNNNLVNNNAFQMMGDNAGALTWQSTETPAACYQRVGREWKVRETGIIGSLQLRVPAATSTLAVKLPAAVNNVVYLLVDNDGDFSSGLISVVPMVLNGTNWESSYNFADGNYYTFATDLSTNRDFNDLPNTWPGASAGINGCNTNGDAVINLSDVNGSRPMVWAGNSVTAEASAVTNATASVDGADDGLVLPPIVSRYQNNVFTVNLNGTIAGATAYFRFWIDWNTDGNFGNDVDGNGNPASYEGSAILTGTGPVPVNVNVLTPFAIRSNFTIRLLVSNAPIANTYATNSSFVYNIGNGEVEDYFFASTVLPVNLRSFTYTETNCKVILHWSTAKEENLKAFVVEGSADGSNFHAVATIAAQNNINGANYFYTTNNPADKYYRLKMNDQNNSFEYSGVLHAATACDAQQISIAPNPAKDILNARGLPLKGVVKILDATGRVVLQQTITNSNMQLNIARFAEGGYYVLVFKDGTVVHREKVVKVN